MHQGLASPTCLCAGPREGRNGPRYELREKRTEWITVEDAVAPGWAAEKTCRVK